MGFPQLLAIYCSVAAVEIFANLTHNTGLQYFSKPALMPVLIIYYSINARQIACSAKFLIISALFFSWLGDVFLLVDKTSGEFFIYGLTAFLAAHIFYIFYFLKIRKFNRVRSLPGALLFVGIAAYSLIFLAYLAPNVKNLLIPVAVYAVAISVMLATSLSAFDFSKNNFGKICVAGALLFVVSDSVLAINRFVSPFEYAPVLVMLTYAFAQLLITEGSLRNLRAIERR